MKLLDKPALVVLTSEEFNACRPYLLAAAYSWYGINEGQCQWWSPFRSRWVSDRDKNEHGESRCYLELECLPHILAVTLEPSSLRSSGHEGSANAREMWAAVQSKELVTP